MLNRIDFTAPLQHDVDISAGVSGASHLVGLLSLATALPPYVVGQEEVAAMAQLLFTDLFERSPSMASVFANTGIRKRHVARPVAWYLEPRGWPERTAVYVEEGSRLFVEAANKALDAAGCVANDVDVVVFISSTGIATPSLDAVVHRQMGFRPDIERVPVFGLGCAGGVSGLAIASRMAAARPGSTVLMVSLELCSLAFRSDLVDKTNVISTALFGDGAAACVLRSGQAGIAMIDGAGEHLWPDTLGIMGWNMDPVGFGVLLAPNLPAFATTNLGPAVEGVLARIGLGTADIGRFICHPGGAKVVTAIERSLELNQGSLDHERTVLSDFGNMSAPTVLFVLARAIAEGLPKRTALLAMGPGFSASCVSLVRAT
ncbi:type III polyketide synthase [Mesorhizobium helmanticense]|uniref:Type III polyketide synthase n=1 Tax=Mesorhizobium helmanticense TaxID=1776423 RepID=A0A2T4J0E2_9HYPH|nr:type III polyketide synthase [Mesorhizobium helmanticense]PTE11298.1 type III polyketide synthase [Mesorhizobium helmanticense]